MSSSFVKDCTDASGASSSTRGNKTFIIFVNNDNTAVPAIEGQEFQNLLVNHGADPSNVSVLQMGHPVANLDFNLPQLGSIEGFDATVPQQIDQQPNFMVDSFAGDTGYAELPIDEDAIKKLESVLHTQEAKDILGDALLDMVSNPLVEQLPNEESFNEKGVGGSGKRAKSPIRRSQRQMDKAEREEVEKILAENQLMLQKEREQLRKAEEEKEEAEENQKTTQCVNPSCETEQPVIEMEQPKLNTAESNSVEPFDENTKKTEPVKGKVKSTEHSKGKIKPGEGSKGKTKTSDSTKGKTKTIDPTKGKTKPKPNNFNTPGKGKVVLPKLVAKSKESSVFEDSPEKSLILENPSVENISNIKIAPDLQKQVKMEDTDENIKLLKGVLKEVSINLKKLEVKNFSSGMKKEDAKPAVFTNADSSNSDVKMPEILSPIKLDKLENDQKILVTKRGTQIDKDQPTDILSVQNVSPTVIDKLNTFPNSSNSAFQQKGEAITPSKLLVKPKIHKNITDLKHNKKTSKELYLDNPEKPKSKNTSLCPPISKSLMNYKIPHKTSHKAFYTSGYKKEVTNKTVNNISPSKKGHSVEKSVHNTAERRQSKESINPTSPKQNPIKVAKVDLERSISMPIGSKTHSTPTAKSLNSVKPNYAKKVRPSFEVALNSSKEIKVTKVQKTVERENLIIEQSVSTTPKKFPPHIKTTTVHIKTKPVIKKDLKELKKPKVNDKTKEDNASDVKRDCNIEKNQSVEFSPVRKSKRPAKKKQLDEQFICPTEEASNDEDSQDSLSEDDDSESDEECDSPVNDYDDPKRLWCICKKPHNHRFMICCDSCEDWFHGSCVGVTKTMGREMENHEKEWTCPKCKPPTPDDFKKMKHKKSTLRKWSDDPKTTNQDPSEARVLVYEKSTGTVLSGNAAPTLSILQDWLDAHQDFSPLLPSMMKSVVTDALTGLKSLKVLKEPEREVLILSSDEFSPVKRQKEEPRDAKVSKSRDGGIIIKDTGYDYDPEFEPIKTKIPKKTILIDSIHPEHLSLGLKPERFSHSINPGHFYKKDQRKVERQRSREKKKHEQKEDPDRRSSLTNVDMTQKAPLEDKSPKLNIRKNVKKMLFDALSFRKSQVAEEFSDITADQLTELCAKIEEQLFVTFSRDVGFKYKARYRSLVFNIKDSKNGGLYRQILSGTVSPSKLAKMTSEELASKELAEWRQRAEKMELEAIQKHELEMLEMKTKFVMKTHKGEIEIDKDDFNKNKETAPELVNKLPEEVLLRKDEETPDQINHRNHIYDPMCIICIKMTIDTKQVSSEKHKKSHKEKKHIYKRKRDRHKRHDRSRHRHRHESDKRRDSDKDERRDQEKRRNSSLSDERHHNKKQKKESEKSNRCDVDHAPDRVVVSTSDDVVFLPSLESSISNVKDAEPTSTVIGTPIEPETFDDPLDLLLPYSPATPPMPQEIGTSPGPVKSPLAGMLSPRSVGTPPVIDIDDGLLSPATPPLPEDTDRHTPPPSTVIQTGSQPIWRGGISMQDVATFNAAAFEVSGKAHYFTGDVPSSIDIVGRISPDTVWSYITQMKKSGSKEILVIRFQPSSEEEKVSYIALYCYLSSKKRYGVIGNCEKSVKDFYIVPLAAHQPIPQVLLPIDGPGFEESRPHMLIGVVIRAKHRRIYNTQLGVWIDVGSPPHKRNDASELPELLSSSPPLEFEEESYTPPQLPDKEYSDSEKSPSPPSEVPSGKESPSQDQFDMLAELNRQIEKDKEEITSMQKTFDQEMDDNPSDEGNPKEVDTCEIKLPSNLQDILDNIKQKEVAIKVKEMEIERRLSMVADEPTASTSNPFGVVVISKDVDLRVLLPQKKPFELNVDEDLRQKQQNRQSSLSEMTDEQLISKASELESDRSHVEALGSNLHLETQVPYHLPSENLMHHAESPRIFHGGHAADMHHGNPTSVHRSSPIDAQQSRLVPPHGVPLSDGRLPVPPHIHPHGGQPFRPHIQGHYMAPNISYSNGNNRPCYPMEEPTNSPFSTREPIRPPPFHLGHRIGVDPPVNQNNLHPYQRGPFNEYEPFIRHNHQPTPYYRSPGRGQPDSYPRMDRFSGPVGQMSEQRYVENDRFHPRQYDRPSLMGNLKRPHDEFSDLRQRQGGSRRNGNKIRRRERRH